MQAMEKWTSTVVSAFERRKPIIVLPPELFEDQNFPYNKACSAFLQSGQHHNCYCNQIRWIRPHEMVAKPELYVDGTSRRDVIQGVLGDCWLLSTCAALAKKVRFALLLARVS